MSIDGQRGLTIIELIVFIVIVGVALAGVLGVFSTVVRGSADPVREKQAFAVAESLLEEILNKNFCDPDTANTATAPVTCGVNTVEASRDLYDAALDYNGYTTTGINDVSGAAIAGLGGYNVNVVVLLPAAGVTAGDGTAGSIHIVVVTITDTVTNRSYSLTGYKFNND